MVSSSWRGAKTPPRDVADLPSALAQLDYVAVGFLTQSRLGRSLAPSGEFPITERSSVKSTSGS
jgi:hypothetical protein